MGFIHAEIQLLNGGDLDLMRRNLIGEEEVRHINTIMLVDSGSFMLCINEAIQSILQLSVVDKRPYSMADGSVQEFDIVGPVTVKFQNRNASCNAVVLPGNAEPLLGAIPMEEMDVLINPQRQELVINPKHPEGAILRL
jgi:clan AA aspartic protease